MRAASVFALVSLAAGCSAGPSSGAVALDDFGAAFVGAWCSVYERCGDPNLAAFLGTGAACSATLAPQLEDGSLAGIAAAVSAGTVAYHGERVADCVAALEGTECVSLVPPLAACVAVFEGLVPDSSACVIEEECRAGSYCAFASGCPGTCQPRAAAGGSCASGPCQVGLACVAGTCGPPADPTGASCMSGSSPCPGLGFDCVGDVGGASPGTCVSWDTLLDGALGDRCDVAADDHCDRGLSCAYAGVIDGLSAFRCVAPAAAGGACAPAFPDMCSDGQFCALDASGASGSCAPLPGVGETCGGTFPSFRCAAGLRCGGSSGTTPGVCEQPARIGQACVEPSDCVSGSCVAGACAPSAGRCASSTPAP